MITSIFSKSKPVNFIIVFLIVIIAFSVAQLRFSDSGFKIDQLLIQAITFFFCLTTIFVLNFVVSKNSLTKKNNYEILLFSLFILLIPQTLLNWKIIISNFFILLALRRLISIRSQKNIMKKLFDAALWVAIASLFYFWSILFFVVIISALIFYSENNIKYWLIPYAGILTVFLIVTTYSILWNDNLYWFFDLNYEINLDFSNYNTTRYLVATTMLISFGIWSSFFYLQTIKSKMKVLKPGFKIVWTAFLMALGLVVISPYKEGNEFLFLFAPLSVIITNYVETIKEKWFKEVFLAAFIVVPLLLLVL